MTFWLNLRKITTEGKCCFESSIRGPCTVGLFPPTPNRTNFECDQNKSKPWPRFSWQTLGFMTCGFLVGGLLSAIKLGILNCSCFMQLLLELERAAILKYFKGRSMKIVFGAQFIQLTIDLIDLHITRRSMLTSRTSSESTVFGRLRSMPASARPRRVIGRVGEQKRHAGAWEELRDLERLLLWLLWLLMMKMMLNWGVNWKRSIDSKILVVLGLHELPLD